MKSLLIIQLISLISLSNCFPNPLGDLYRFTESKFGALGHLSSIADLIPEALTGISLVPCPNQEEPPSEFTWDDYLGSWYEIERTAMLELFEYGQRCNRVTYDKNIKDQIIANVSFVSPVLNGPVNFKKAINIRQNQTNIYGMNLSPFQETKYWIVDTDLDSYSLVFSCQNFLHATIRNAWILGRRMTINKAVRDQLIIKLGALGIAESSLIKTDQSCSTFSPIK